MRYLLLGLLTLSAFLLYSLTLATGNATEMANYFWLVVVVNGSLLATLLFVVLGQVWSIAKDIRNNVFGAKLTRKLMTAFSFVVILPSLFILLVSSQFISHSIESWFGQTIETSFDNGLRLGESILEEQTQKTRIEATKAQPILENNMLQADELVFLSRDLAKIKDEYFASTVAIYDLSSQKIVAQVGRLKANEPLVFLEDGHDTLEKKGWLGSVERADDRLYTRVLLMFNQERIKSRYVFLFERPVPLEISQSALALEDSRAEYSQLAYSKDAMKTSYLMTLIIATLLAVMMSLVCALIFAKKFTAPLQVLSAGTKAVAQGDFSLRSPVFREDELGILTSSFNRMTEQLAEAQKKREALNAYLENILGSLSAGVVAFEPDGKIRMVNSSAEKILNLNFEQFGDEPWSTWSKTWTKSLPFTHLIETILEKQDEKNGVQLEYMTEESIRVLLGKVITLPERVGGGYMFVLDDVTVLVNAQKEAAWGEVAKRLAHEIRNPLTPIQLSAERLAMKLESKLSEQDAGILIRSTDTIVKQVAALKGMVEAFRNYARMPVMSLQKVDINEILKEVLVLYESYDCKIFLNLSNIPLWVSADAATMRQVFHNLLQNAQDATIDKKNPEINVHTLVKNDKAVIIVEDNGSGFEAQLLKEAFEPYVTNKATGTGLGLAVVKKIIIEHKGEIAINNREEGGAQITIVLPLVEA